jgi:Bacterial mobilisation protein (MobC).
MGASVSYYVRTRLFKKSEASVINAVEYLRAYKEGVRELKAIGNNMNQLARYVNYVEKSGQIQPAVLEELISLLQDFIRSQREVADLDRKILRS